jgi:hypothetical protein
MEDLVSGLSGLSVHEGVAPVEHNLEHARARTHRLKMVEEIVLVPALWLSTATQDVVQVKLNILFFYNFKNLYTCGFRVSYTKVT